MIIAKLFKTFGGYITYFKILHEEII